MFGKFCCAAQEAMDGATEVIGTTVGAARDAAKASVDQFTLKSLKGALEGSRVQEWEAPDVFIEVLQVDLGDGVDVASLLNFSLKGLKVKTRVEIVGTAAQLTGMVAAGGAKKAADKVGAAEAAVTDRLGLPSLGIGSYVADAAAAAKAKLASSASSGVETKSTEFDLEVDLEKVLGVTEVKASARVVGASSDAISKYIANTSVQKYAEDAISRRVTAIVTDWQNSTLTAEVAKAKLGAKASELAAAADELAIAKGLKKKK